MCEVLNLVSLSSFTRPIIVFHSYAVRSTWLGPSRAAARGGGVHCVASARFARRKGVARRRDVSDDWYSMHARSQLLRGKSLKKKSIAITNTVGPY